MVIGLEKTQGVVTTALDMCRFGMVTRVGDVDVPVRKPTKVMTNSAEIAKEVGRRCEGGDRHEELTGGRAKACAIYPDAFCKAICVGLVRQRRSDERAAGAICQLMDTEALMEVNVENDWFWDTAKGGWLNPDL